MRTPSTSRVAPLSTRFSHVVFPQAFRRPAVVNLAVPEEKGTRPESIFRLELPEESASFLEWLFLQAGLDATKYRPETLARRLPSCLRALKVHSAAHARRLLEDSPALVPAAVSAMLIGVTSFFRDPVLFERLKGEIIPALAGPRQGIHAWSIGCSEGAEIYSVAMILDAARFLTRSYLLGSDCRPDAIERAQEGLFDSLSVKETPPGYLSRYMEREGSAWRVTTSIRSRVRWRTEDILKTREPGLWDLILFRNTAMYLRSEALETLWERLETSLRPGGVLVLGKAERPWGAKRLSPMGPCLYRRAHR